MRARFALWRCRVLDWHGHIDSSGFDGASFQGRCQRCGRRGLFDSNGDFFATDGGRG